MNFHSGGLHGSTFTRSGPGPALAVSWDWGTDGERASPRKLTAVKALAGLVSKVRHMCTYKYMIFGVDSREGLSWARIEGVTYVYILVSAPKHSYWKQ